MARETQELGGRDEGNDMGLSIADGLYYRTIFNATSNSMAITEFATGIIIDVNAAWSRATGFDREHAIGKLALELGLWVSPSVRAACIAEFEAKEGLKDYESSLVLKSVEVPHLISAEFVELNGIRCALWEFRDILKHKRMTEALIKGEQRVLALLAASEQARQDLLVTLENKKAAEEALRQSQTRLALFAEATFEGIVQSDAGRIVDCNEQLGRMLGYPVSELIGMHISSFVPPEELSRVTDNILHTRESITEHCLVRKDGTRIIVEAHGRPFFPNSPVRHTAIRDITERKRVEESLRESEQRLKLTLEATKVIAWEINIAEGSHFEAGPVDEIFGREKGFRHASHEDTVAGVHPDDRERVRRAIDDALEGKREYAETFRVLHADGSVRWIAANGTLLRDGQGRPERLLGIGRDVTRLHQAEEERRTLEAQLQQSHKLEAIGQLAGGVAHDLNNFLVPILGYGEMLLEGVPESDPRHEQATQIVLATERARDLVQQLLTFARKQTIELKPLDVNQVIEGFEKLWRRVIRENIIVRIQSSPESATIQGDKGQIEQILMNLALNAQDAMPDGGALEICTACTNLDEAEAANLEHIKPGEYVQLTVSDTGAGMDADMLPKVFEPFFTTKEPGKGTGLGLATVYGIVLQHGGAIRAVSAPGQGTAFQLFFPRITVPDAPQPSPARAPLERGTETILVVEDQDQVRNMVSQLLQRQGHTVLVATSGEEALQRAAAHPHPIQLLLTDMVMTGMNGRELYSQLSIVRPAIRVLYMSGYPDDTLSQNGVLNEGTFYIQKPFTLDALMKKTREALSA